MSEYTMELIAKTFEELTTRELYEILRVRSEIFVVEQQCVYQDLDRIDYESLHVFYQDDAGEVQAYVRAYPKKGSGHVVQMGRVLSRQHGIGLGGRILRAGIEAVKADYDAEEIFIEAQVYATGFYEREGFVSCSEEFLEDGIPHMAMKLKL